MRLQKARISIESHRHLSTVVQGGEYGHSSCLSSSLEYASYKAVDGLIIKNHLTYSEWYKEKRVVISKRVFDRSAPSLARQKACIKYKEERTVIARYKEEMTAITRSRLARYGSSIRWNKIFSDSRSLRVRRPQMSVFKYLNRKVQGGKSSHNSDLIHPIIAVSCRAAEGLIIKYHLEVHKYLGL
ncbi:hypothetical protein C8R42DRAFT_638192 [Lentinula raphanica]|nr:hypothetical protein C8R42DRAFT_638192 [Lentinula raphanica]